MLNKPWASARRAAALATVAVAVAAASGCTRIETGNVALMKDFHGAVKPEVETGTVWHIFDSMIAELDTTQTRIDATDMMPKDSTGEPLKGLNYTLIVSTNPDKIPAFYKLTREIDVYRDNAGNDVSMVGLNVIKGMMPSFAQAVMEKSSLRDVAAHTAKYEDDIQKEAQDKLNALYPDTFVVHKAIISRFSLPDAIQQQVDATAGLEAERNRMVEEKKNLDLSRDLVNQRAELDANALRAAVDSSKLSPEQIISWKNAEANEAMAHSLTPAITRTLPVAPSPAKP
jgi:hypothetical protein